MLGPLAERRARPPQRPRDGGTTPTGRSARPRGPGPPRRPAGAGRQLALGGRVHGGSGVTAPQKVQNKTRKPTGLGAGPRGARFGWCARRCAGHFRRDLAGCPRPNRGARAPLYPPPQPPSLREAGGAVRVQRPVCTQQPAARPAGAPLAPIRQLLVRGEASRYHAAPRRSGAGGGGLQCTWARAEMYRARGGGYRRHRRHRARLPAARFRPRRPPSGLAARAAAGVVDGEQQPRRGRLGRAVHRAEAP